MAKTMQNDGKKGRVSSKPGGKKLWRALLFFLFKHGVLLGTAFICAGILFVLTMDQFVMPLVVKHGTVEFARNLRGKTVEEARSIIGNRFVLRADSTEYNNEFPPNTIFYQYPAPGTKIKPGRTIFTIVSKGPKPISLPNVTGMPVQDAILTIEALGLMIDHQEWIHSNEYRVKGIVARQYPPGDQEVPENTRLILYISDGKPETDVIMPDLIGLGLSAALDTLYAYQFDRNKIRIQKEEAPELLPETVIDQYPDPGRPTPVTIEVNLVVSTSE